MPQAPAKQELAKRAAARIRTEDLRITNASLYQLSYGGILYADRTDPRIPRQVWLSDTNGDSRFATMAPYPGHCRLPAGQCVNCRCAVTTRVVDG